MKKVVLIIIMSALFSTYYFTANKFANAESFSLPHRFSAGDVLSADILNEVFAQLQDSVKTYSEIDLIGTWTCESYLMYSAYADGGNSDDGWAADADNLFGILTNVEFTFSNNGNGTYQMQSNSPNPFTRNTSTPADSVYKIRGNLMFFNRGGFPDDPDSSSVVYQIKSLGDTRIGLYAMSHGGNIPNIICDKMDLPPDGPTELVASFSGSTITLTWSDNSSDETGFTILRKDSLTGDYNEIATASANATSTTNTLTSNGTYWFRVLATNANGSSVGSNVVKVIKE